MGAGCELLYAFQNNNNKKSMSLQAIKDVLMAHRIAKEAAYVREGVSHPPSKSAHALHVVHCMRIERYFTVC